jgi:hypothetical protein
MGSRWPSGAPSTAQRAVAGWEDPSKPLILLAGVAGLEPATPGFGVRLLKCQHVPLIALSQCLQGFLKRGLLPSPA